MKRASSNQGTVTLVALCLLAVMGIALAGYLSVSNQAMKSSNRMYAKEASRNLAEMGLEQALQAWQTNSWSTWTSGTTTSTWSTSGTTATCTITLASSLYGRSGITPSVNLRIDRYNAKRWSAATTYSANNMVWMYGVWFHCTNGHANRIPPNTSYWTSAPAPWNADATYNIGDIVITGGSAYRCTTANTNQLPPNATYWTSNTMAVWSSATTYALNDVALVAGTPYRCITAHSNQSPPNLSYWISAPTIYSQGTAALPDGTSVRTLLRSSIAPAPLFPNAVGATSAVTMAAGGTIDSYNSILGTAAGFSAVLAGGNTSGTAVTVTTATVKGYVAAPPASTTPFAPQASFGSGVTPTLKNSDGTVTSPHPSSANIDLTRISRSPYIPQFDILSVTGAGNLPATYGGSTTYPTGAVTLGVAPTAGTASVPRIYNISYTQSTAGGFIPNNQTLTIVGPVILNVTGQYFGTYNNGKIQIDPGGSLEVYFSTSTEMLHSYGGVGIDNRTNDPTKCILVSAGNNNTVNYHLLHYSSSLPFTGIVYMPNAYLTVYSNAQTYGALSATNVRFSTAGNLRYDTALRTAGSVGTFIDQPYLATEVRELTDVTERITLP